MLPALPSNEGDGKRRAIAQLLSLRGATAANVRNVLDLLHPDAASRWDVREALARNAQPVCTSVRLPLKGHGEFEWPVALVQDLLPRCLQHCDGFRSQFMRALANHPCTPDSPWRLILYLDEITPGNPLRPDNKRKITALYASWLELGDFLRVEEAWLTLGVIRTDTLKYVQGGIGVAVRHLIRALFLGRRSLSDCGVAVNNDPPTLFFCKFLRLLSDEAAGKAVISVKGASGIRPCLDCKNVVALGDDVNPSLASTDNTGYLVDIACADSARFDPQTDADLWQAHDRLATLKREPRMTKKQFTLEERASGVSFDEAGLLHDVELRAIFPPSCYARDPMHTMLAGGVMSTEMYAVIRALSAEIPGFSFSTLAAFAGATWQFPKCRAKINLPNIFSAVREAATWKDKSFKAGASETLAVIPIVRYFIDLMVPDGSMQSERASFMAACHVVDLMQAVKLQCTAAGLAKLKAATHAFFQLHVAAYGSELVRPKHHYMVGHLTKQAEADVFWLDCFVHERKHQLTKDASNHIKNTRAFERSALQMVLAKAMQQMSSIMDSALLPPHAECPELTAACGERCDVSRDMRANFGYFAVGDLLLVGSGACFVEACVLRGRQLQCVVSELQLVDRPTLTTSHWVTTGRAALLPMLPHVCRHASAWFYRQDGIVVALG